MATSGTVTFRPEVDEIVTEACERCGLDPTLIDRRVAVSARRSLNLMFSEWSVRGINYWNTAEAALSLTQSTRSYALPAGTVDVLTAVLRRDSNDTNMTRLAMTDYNGQTNKTTEGMPTQYFLTGSILLRFIYGLFQKIALIRLYIGLFHKMRILRLLTKIQTYLIVGQKLCVQDLLLNSL